MDRLSNLPAEIIEEIILRMPLRKAGQTCALSRKWRNLWVTHPNLLFDDQGFRGVQANTLVTRIYQVLLPHEATIREFTLKHSNLQSCSHINNWISFLSNKGVHNFTLRLYEGEFHKLPVPFFSFLELRSLNLRLCVLKPPHHFSHFDFLVSIKFKYVTLNPSFISKCPLLEHLNFFKCNGLDIIDVDAPNLKSIKIFGHFNSLCFKNAPVLEHMEITYSRDVENEGPLVEETSNIIKVFSCPTALEFLFLGVDSLHFLVVGDVPNALPHKLQHLEILHVDLSFELVEEIRCVLCILKSCPHLELLSVDACTDKYALMEGAVDYLQSWDLTNFSLNHLQLVKMSFISGVKPEVEFMKRILAISTVGELVVKADPEATREEVNMVEEKIKDLKKLLCEAQAAKIIFDRYPTI